MYESRGAEFKLKSAIGRARNRALKSEQPFNERRRGKENANKVIRTDSRRGSWDRAIEERVAFSFKSKCREVKELKGTRMGIRRERR